MEQQFSEQDSLQLINSMINKAKNSYSESGTLYLVWGFTILICSVTQFIAIKFFNYQQAYYIWFLTWGVFFYQVFFLARKKKRVKVKTYTDEILGYVWICFIVCLFVMLFVLIQSKSFTLINTVILVLYGIPTFLSGAILKVRPLVIGGIACWVLAEVSLFIPIEYHILLISVAVIVAWIIPGMFLRNKFLKQPISYAR